ncbi:Aste57867_13112 [Aphanomyces stellatus]|uniref:Aste57867_13112 protein n=1 Tax=Aphanomyces stellatus TaxID=120398 RepID=A0A485KY67_9STRA|nr:hypothetical protein As57867_013064 [Aphanomyces stellatus]VFT89956.1 Aste57867_13112 [Aphanomyces stellatus]
MVEGANGRIELDSVNIATVALSTLRSRFTIIPRTPFSLAARSASTLIWNVLKKVHLADAVSADGLEFQVAEKGSNLSLLLCIRGRAGRSHGNLESDRLIQQTIKECFKDVTMLIIANRLDTIIDSDRIFFLDHSHVVEFDAPSVLLANDASAFAQLAKQAHIGN